MNVKQLMSEIEGFYSTMKFRYAEINLEFMNCIEGIDFWTNCEILQDKHGIYIFTNQADNILYIGKADSSDICTRVWSHLGTPDKEAAIIYPSGDFAKKTKWQGEAAEKVMKGQFRVCGISIVPKIWASVFEAFAQTITVTADKELPPFNFRIG